MLSSNEDKKLLIESMKKLTLHVSNNPQRQKQIFISLSKNDLLKIISNLNDQNEYLRRISALLLCQLLFNNEEIKSSFVTLLEMHPRFGRICISSFPETLYRQPIILKKIIELLHSPPNSEEQNRMCWVINLERKALKMESYQFKRYSSFTFLDPSKNIFGFTYLEKKNGQQKGDSQKSSNSNNHSNNHNNNHSNNQSNNQSNSQSNSFYTSYLEARNRSKQAKLTSSLGNNPMRMSLDLNSDGFVNQKKEIAYIRPMSNRNKEIPETKTNHEITDHHKSREVYGQPYTKSSYEIAGQNRSKPNGLNLTGVSYQQEVSKLDSSYENEQMTDRKNYRNYYPNSPLQSERIREPESAKHNYSNTHENFYKRVKEILKK